MVADSGPGCSSMKTPNYSSSNTTYSGSDEATVTHRQKLKEFCRMCGNPTTLCSDRPPVPVCTIANKLMKIYQLDVTNDNSHVHPIFICKSCMRAVDRNWKIYRKGYHSREIPLFQFFSHTHLNVKYVHITCRDLLEKVFLQHTPN
jgi:hypothetical protein